MGFDANRDAIDRLDAIAAAMSDDPEIAHSEADAVLLSVVDPAVKAAYERVVAACRWWATA